MKNIKIFQKIFITSVRYVFELLWNYLLKWGELYIGALFERSFHADYDSL